MQKALFCTAVVGALAHVGSDRRPSLARRVALAEGDRREVVSAANAGRELAADAALRAALQAAQGDAARQAADHHLQGAQTGVDAPERDGGVRGRIHRVGLDHLFDATEQLGADGGRKEPDEEASREDGPVPPPIFGREASDLFARLMRLRVDYDEVRRLLALGRVAEAIELLLSGTLDEEGWQLLARAHAQKARSQLASMANPIDSPRIMPSEETHPRLFERLGQRLSSYFDLMRKRFSGATKQVSRLGKTYLCRRPAQFAVGLVKRMLARAEGDASLAPVVVADLVRSSYREDETLPAGWIEIESRLYPQSGYSGTLYRDQGSGSYVMVHQLPLDLSLLADHQAQLADARHFLISSEATSSVLHTGLRLGGMIAGKLGEKEAILFDFPGSGEAFMSKPDLINSWNRSEGEGAHYLPISGAGSEEEVMQQFIEVLRGEEDLEQQLDAKDLIGALEEKL